MGNAYLLIRESSEPAQTTDDVLLLGLVLEVGLGRDSLDQGLLVRSGSTKLLLQDILPGTGLLEGILLSIVEEANVDKDLDELGETGVTESTTI
jgi:hypothetical protein